MLIRNLTIKHINIKFQKKFFFSFNAFKQSKIFVGKETSLILHPELAVDINDKNNPNKIKIENIGEYENNDKEYDKNLVIDDNLDFLQLDANGIINIIT